MRLAKWQYELLKAMGVNPFDKTRSNDVLAGWTKNNRQKRRKAKYAVQRKKKRKATQASRRRNRGNR